MAGVNISGKYMARDKVVAEHNQAELRDLTVSITDSEWPEAEELKDLTVSITDSEWPEVEGSESTCNVSTTWNGKAKNKARSLA